MSGAVSKFTPEELAELAAFDAEVEQEDDWDAEEVAAAALRDVEFTQERTDSEKRKLAEYKKAYLQKNREIISQKQKLYQKTNRERLSENRKKYYESNKDNFLEYQKAYDRSHKEHKRAYHKKYMGRGSKEIAEKSSLQHWRKKHGYSMEKAGVILGVSDTTIYRWERGITPLPERIRKIVEEGSE